jgi:peptidoglycan/LPS O-acetylase OafA/YrhL
MFGTYRTFLALMVVALHLGGLPLIGGYAVFGFYTLSGYLMTLIMQTNYGYTLSGVSKYAANRFLRIYPMYWVSIAFSAILVWLLGEQFTSTYHKSIYLPKDFLEIFKNIAIFFPFLESPRLTPPAWALTVEIFFYILIGLGLSRKKRIIKIWFTLSVIYHLIALILHLDFEHRYFTVFAASLPFSTGALLFHYKSELIERIDRIQGNLGEFLPYIIVFLILLNWFLGNCTGGLEGIHFYSNYILCSLIVVVLSERKKLPYINKKFDKWMGDFSYPIYLIHYQVGLIVIVIFKAVGIGLERPSLMLMFISMPLIFVFSWMLTVALERPIESLRTKVKS